MASNRIREMYDCERYLYFVGTFRKTVRGNYLSLFGISQFVKIFRKFLLEKYFIVFYFSPAL